MSEECKCCETDGDCINGLCMSCANFVHNLEKHYDKMKEQRDELLEAAQFALDAFGQSYSQESEAKARLRAIIAKCEKRLDDGDAGLSSRLAKGDPGTV